MPASPPPLQLIIDIVAWLRIFASFWAFELASRAAFARATMHNGRWRFWAFDFPTLSRLLADAEADLDWGLARRAAALAGLEVESIARVVRSAPETRRALKIRAVDYLTRYIRFEMIAHRMAARIRALRDPLRASHRLTMALQSPRPTLVAASAFALAPRPGSGQHGRLRDHGRAPARARAPP
jgi:hypothetical protein